MTPPSTFEAWYGDQPPRLKGQMALSPTHPEANEPERAMTVAEVVRMVLSNKEVPHDGQPDAGGR